MKQACYYIMLLLFVELAGIPTTVQATESSETKHFAVLSNDSPAEKYSDYGTSAKGKFLPDSCYLSLTQAQKEKALARHDSLIRSIEAGKAPENINIVEIYQNRGHLLRCLHRYKEACAAYDRSMIVSDSLIKKEYGAQVDSLRQKHDVNTLLLEKINLQSEKRQVAFIFALCILFIAICISLYYYQTLAKTQRLQKEVLQQSIKAQESEEVKASFIKSICHEIRTPLNSINGFSEILSDDFSTPEEQKDYQLIIQENTRLLTSLLHSLVEVANLDSLTASLTLKPIEINHYCRLDMQYLEETEGKPEIDYQLNLPENDYKVYAHPQYLSLLLRALLNNANKFTTQGFINLSCRKDSRRKMLMVSVTDTGCGVPTDKHEYVFRRFTKLDTFRQGSGLGLYLCKLIIRHMQGDIYIDKTYTKGSRFIFTLPMENAKK